MYLQQQKQSSFLYSNKRFEDSSETGALCKFTPTPLQVWILKKPSEGKKTIQGQQCMYFPEITLVEVLQ